jgi:hypothetical protein
MHEAPEMVFFIIEPDHIPALTETFRDVRKHPIANT